MEFMRLPLDIVSAVVDEVVRSCDIRQGLHLRCVNRVFDHEILRAYFKSGIIDFHADAPDTKAPHPRYSHGIEWDPSKNINSQARRLSKVNTARLLHGRLDALERYGTELPWLHSLKSAASLFDEVKEAGLVGSRTLESQVPWPGEKSTSRKLCEAVTEYLGVFEVIDSLDPGKQQICCEYHYLPVYDQECHGPPSELVGRSRRPETILDWAILLAIHTQNFPIIYRLLGSGQNRHTAFIDVRASLQHATRIGDQKIVLTLLDTGADINCIGHAGRDFVDTGTIWNTGTPLEAACAEGHVGIVESFLNPCHDLKTFGYQYGAAMVLAAQLTDFHLSTQIVRLLAAKVTSWAEFDGDAREIMKITCQNGNVELGKLIFELAPFNLNEPCTEDSSHLCIAVEHDQHEMVGYLVGRVRKDVWPVTRTTIPDYHVYKALRIAFSLGFSRCAALLWGVAKIYPNHPSRYWWIAASHGHVNLIEFLLENGVKLFEPSIRSGEDVVTYGQAAMKMAVTNGHEPLKNFLLERGVSID